VDPAKYKYNCPGERQVQVEFNMTPEQVTLAGLWEKAPAYALLAFSFLFLGVCLAIGIFKRASYLLARTDSARACAGCAAICIVNSSHRC